MKAAAAPCKEWEAGVAYVNWVRQEVDQVRPAQPMLWLADGSYDTVEMWQSAPERVIAAVRTARNRVLHAYLPPEERRGNRKYGERIKSPAEWMGEWRTGCQHVTVCVRGVERRLRYRLVGPVVRRGAPDCPLFLVVVSGQSYVKGQAQPTRKQRKPAAYLVTAQQQESEWRLPLDPAVLLAWLWQRWEMEVAHREMKSGLGVGEQQCWNPRSAIVSVQWSVWVYALLVLAGYRTWQLSPGPAPAARWSPRPKRWSLSPPRLSGHLDTIHRQLARYRGPSRRSLQRRCRFCQGVGPAKLLFHSIFCHTLSRIRPKSRRKMLSCGCGKPVASWQFALRFNTRTHPQKRTQSLKQ